LAATTVVTTVDPKENVMPVRISVVLMAIAAAAVIFGLFFPNSWTNVSAQALVAVCLIISLVLMTRTNRPGGHP
jgi:membrane protein YdbS with pleckstrin-like domain